MSRDRVHLAIAGLAATAALLLATPGGPAGAEAPRAAPRLGLLAQTFNVAADGAVDIVVAIPAGIDADPEATVVVTAYRAVESRTAVADALAGTLPRSVDAVDLPLAPLPRPAAGQVQITVPVETDVRTPAGLQMPSAGLYPLVVEVLGGGNVLAELTTFVHRLPGADEPPLAEMPLAVTMTTSTPVVLDDATEVVVDDAVLAEYTRLADVLDATAVPLSVRLSPAHLAALTDAGGEAAAVATRIIDAVRGPLGHELLSAPALPLDVSAAAAAGAGATYTQWLRDGEDLLVGTTSVPSRRTITVVDQPLSRAGAALLRDLGSRLLVLPVDLYDTLPDTFGGFTDSTQLVRIDVGDGVTVDAAVVDRTLDDRLGLATTTPTLTAVLAVSDLLAAREQVELAGGDPRRHSITLATRDLTPPEPGTLAAISTLLAQTPGLRATSLDELSVRTDALLFDGREVVVGLPDSVDGDLGERLGAADALRRDATATASMLPATDPSREEWARSIDLLLTSAVDDEQLAAIGERLRSEFDAVRSAVVLPEGFGFTLTGRRSEVPITLQNTGDTTLTVLVRVTSQKLRFPEGDQLVELPPGPTTLNVPIEARSNGKFPVTLEVLTPEGGVRLGDLVPLTARVTALGGLGPFVTGAALLVVLTWWVRHVRMNRRNRAAGTAADRHPSARPRDEEPIDGSGLSPDAATSTLPPS